MRLKERDLRGLINKVLLEVFDSGSGIEVIFEDFRDVYYKEMSRSWGGFEPDVYFRSDAMDELNELEGIISGREEEVFGEFEKSRESGGDDYDLEIFNDACDLLDWSDDSLARLMMEYAHLRYKVRKREKVMGM